MSVATSAGMPHEATLRELRRPTVRPPRPSVFPPALVPVLRERVGAEHPSLLGVGDDALGELLTVVFFAGLHTHEGASHPVRIAFAGRVSADVVLPEGDLHDATPMLLYRWSTLRFEPSRPFVLSELVKLGVVTRGERMYIKVELVEEQLRITGLAREGPNRDGDPYLKIIAPRPGTLSIRRGQDRLVEYEHGRVGTGPDEVAPAPGVVRRALEACATRAGLGPPTHADYLSTVRALVRAMAAHGHGGILVISADEQPDLPATASYRTRNDSTIGQLLRYLDGAAGARRDAAPPPSRRASPASQQLRRVLRGAFTSEADRWIAELGWFTAMDGATVLDRSLGLRGFGVVLPVGREIQVVEATSADATTVYEHDLSTRGTRHLAAATYAKRHAGSVVFVASHDGPVSCFVGDPARDRVTLWRLGTGGLV